MRKRIGVTVMAAWAASTVLLASTPTFWTVSTQADFLKGDVENLSIDSDGRVFLGPVTAQVAETSAPFLWTVLSAADGTLWAGTGNEGQVLKIAPRRQDVDLLRRRRDGGPRARPGAERRTLRRARRPTARSTRSPPTARRRRSSIPTTSTSGPSPRRPTARSSPPPAKRATSTASPRTARDRSSTRRTPPTSWRSRWTRAAT